MVISVATGHLKSVRQMAEAARIPVTELGVAGGDHLIIEGLLDITVARAEAAWKGALPSAFSSL